MQPWHGVLTNYLCDSPSKNHLLMIIRAPKQTQCSQCNEVMVEVMMMVLVVVRVGWG